jgi:phosphatidylserine decarboxylase
MQSILPQHALSRLAGRLVECKQPVVKLSLMKLFLKYYDVSLEEAQSADLNSYPNFQSLFTRSLRRDARPIAFGDTVLVSPVDGSISELGEIKGQQILQVKGRYYDVVDLLALDSQASHPFDNGHFMTLYLAPKDYHRVHMPCDGALTKAVYVPGRLFSVNEKSVLRIPRLFARNERLICYFDSPAGPFAVIFVAALLVAGIHTQFAGRITPNAAKDTVSTDYPSIPFAKGAELGYFCYGSTVILLFPKQRAQFLPQFAAGQSVRMGECIGALN